MRTVSGTILAVAVGLLAGCGDSHSPSPAPEAKSPLAANTNQSTPQTPAQPAAPKDAPADPKAGPMSPVSPVAGPGWELDPEKHTIPTTAASGKLGGAAFAPEVQFQGNALTFRVQKEGSPDRLVTLQLPPDRAKAAAGGFKLTVKPDQPAGPDVPTVTTDYPQAKADTPSSTVFGNGYALTLELGKRGREGLPGKVYLSLPTDEKDFLIGTFTADWARLPTEPPGPDDAPFVQGKVTATGAAPTAQLKVGYAAQVKPEEPTTADGVSYALVGPGWARSDFYKPRTTTLAGAAEAGKPARYEHTRLTPGRYLLFAAVEGGPAAWKWVEVKPDAQLTEDFEFDATKFGGLEVKVPADTKEKVRVAPADATGTPTPPGLFAYVAFALGLEADSKDGGAKFDKLGPGKYEVRAGELAGTVEVKPGETAKLELVEKK